MQVQRIRDEYKLQKLHLVKLKVICYLGAEIGEHQLTFHRYYKTVTLSPNPNTHDILYKSKYRNEDYFANKYFLTSNRLAFYTKQKNI